MNICTVPWKNAAKRNRAGHIVSSATVLDSVKTVAEKDVSLFTTQTDFQFTKIAGVATVLDSVKFAEEGGGYYIPY